MHAIVVYAQIEIDSHTTANYTKSEQQQKKHTILLTVGDLMRAFLHWEVQSEVLDFEELFWNQGFNSLNY